MKSKTEKKIQREETNQNKRKGEEREEKREVKKTEGK